jgi:phage terminase large subunit GpA-like protein
MKEYGRGELSFWLNAFVSPWMSWVEIIREFLSARGDSRRMQVVYNTIFGQVWENRGDTMDEEGMMARREDYDAELPDGVLVLTCGIDTQDDRIEYEVVGHGHFGETWGISAGIIMGKPDSDETWKELDAVLDRVWKFRDGVGLKIAVAFMDEGGHYTQEVRIRCRERLGKKLYAIKGMAGQDRPFTSPPKQQKIIVDGKHYGSCWVYSIGVDAGKQMIMDSLRVMEPGNRYAHFPRRDDYGYAFFHGLLSERLVYKEERRQPWSWEKIPGHERNERLDCRNYAMAAFKTLSADLDGQENRLREARAAKAASESGGEGKPESAPVVMTAERRRQAQKTRKTSDVRPEDFYDKW